MPNPIATEHVHLILVAGDMGGLRAALGEAHRRYTRQVNLREGWRGYLWQGRFASVALDEPYLLTAARYGELNPVRARLAERPATGAGRARAHLDGRDDALARIASLLALAPDWAAFLAAGLGRTLARRKPAPGEGHTDLN